MKLVDIGVSKSPAGNGVRVRVPPAAHISKLPPDQKENLAYIVGVALGDGNLSNPNGRAVRLRITCATIYPKIVKEIMSALKILFPNNKVSAKKRNDSHCLDISIYSNKLLYLLPWKVGSKAKQHAHVPSWILSNQHYTRLCLKGLIQTDGCIYIDRGYRMVNFTNNTKILAEDVHNMFIQLGYKPSFMKVRLGPNQYKYTTRIARDTQKLITELDVYKA